MKTFFLLLSILCLSVTQLNAQAPEGINYQAVIRNSSGTLVASTTVAIRIQLKQGSATGAIVYQERHSVLTSAQGLINLVIGSGTVQSGSFGAINWGSGPYFVNLAVDFSNGTNYQDFGTQQLMSVPFALYAKTAGNQLNQWRYGNGAPATSLGAFGDFYLDVQNGNVYYKNTGSSWVLTGNITGPQGATGATGPAGPQGPQGATGTQGLTGPAGPQGIQGATGATGAQGPAGVAGPQGPAGTNGNTILSGTSNPTAGIGVNGDYYMNTATNTFFGPKTNGTWPIGFSMVGPQGAQGIQGATGPQGPIGLTGPAGPTGAQGPQGLQGVAGTNGLNALIKTTTEPAGSNCANGGTKIETGLDANGNGTLDASEVNASQTQYVCNGGGSSSTGNGTYSGNSIISNDTVSPLMKYIGSGQEGAFDCSTFSGVLSGEHFYTNFKVPSNCTLQIGKAQTTIIHVKDTCFINGVINGNGGLVAPYTENRTNLIGATGDYSGGPNCGQSGYYYTFNWTYSPEGLNQLLGYGHLKTTGERWAQGNMSLNDIRAASFLGTRIHGCTSNLPNCGYSMAQGGAGLIIICKVLIFNGQITLNGTNGPAGLSGGGSLIISADNIVSNVGIVSTLGGQGSCCSGNGIKYIINY